jgi:hypothetical protein
MHSVFLPAPFSPSLVFRYIHSSVLNGLSLLIAHSAPAFLSFHPIPFFSLLVHTSKSRHHFSFFLHSFSPGIPEFPVIHFPYFLLNLDSLILSLLSCLSVSLSLSLSSTFIHPPFALNLSTRVWHTRFFSNISLSPSFPCFFFLSSPASS